MIEFENLCFQKTRYEEVLEAHLVHVNRRSFIIEQKNLQNSWSKHRDKFKSNIYLASEIDYICTMSYMFFGRYLKTQWSRGLSLMFTLNQSMCQSNQD